jgi:hypothetical protein
MTEPAADPAGILDPTTGEPAPGETPAALLAALLELERHVAEAGWDQAPRLFALVRTDELISAEPQLAAELGLRSSAEGAPADALTAVEQDQFGADGGLIDALAPIVWPETVFGCALSVERTFLPSSAEAELPEDDAAAAAYVAGHPRREEVRVLVGADRAGNRHGVARLGSQPDELLQADDLVPGLTEAVAHTLTAELPAAFPR